MTTTTRDDRASGGEEGRREPGDGGTNDGALAAAAELVMLSHDRPFVVVFVSRVRSIGEREPTPMLPRVKLVLRFRWEGWWSGRGADAVDEA